MKKALAICLLSLGLAACTGNPPAWWNPGNVYSPENKKDTPATTTPAAQVTDTSTQKPTEESISLPDEAYEEMTLTPLQDEEGENDSGDASAQSVPDPEDLLPPPSILN